MRCLRCDSTIISSVYVAPPFEYCWPECHSYPRRNVIHRGAMPKRLYPQHIVQRFCSDENGTTLRVWNRHQSSLLPRGMRLVSNTRMLRYEACVESAQHSPSIQHMPVHGISGMRLPSHACMLSTSHTNSPLSSLGKAAYGSWGYTAGLKILRSQSFAPAEDAPLSCLPALLRP